MDDKSKLKLPRTGIVDIRIWQKKHVTSHVSISFDDDHISIWLKSDFKEFKNYIGKHPDKHFGIDMEYKFINRTEDHRFIFFKLNAERVILYFFNKFGDRVTKEPLGMDDGRTINQWVCGALTSGGIIYNVNSLFFNETPRKNSLPDFIQFLSTAQNKENKTYQETKVYKQMYITKFPSYEFETPHETPTGLSKSKFASFTIASKEKEEHDDDPTRKSSKNFDDTEQRYCDTTSTCIIG